MKLTFGQMKDIVMAYTKRKSKDVWSNNPISKGIDKMDKVYYETYSNEQVRRHRRFVKVFIGLCLFFGISAFISSVNESSREMKANQYKTDEIVKEFKLFRTTDPTSYIRNP